MNVLISEVIQGCCILIERYIFVSITDALAIREGNRANDTAVAFGFETFVDESIIKTSFHLLCADACNIFIAQFTVG